MFCIDILNDAVTYYDTLLPKLLPDMKSKLTMQYINCLSVLFIKELSSCTAFSYADNWINLPSIDNRYNIL
jgi:hypothetical protein